MQQVLTVCLAVADIVFTSAHHRFAAAMAVALIAPAAAMIAVLDRRREFFSLRFAQ
jgi:hypothetical protein